MRDQLNSHHLRSRRQDNQSERKEQANSGTLLLTILNLELKRRWGSILKSKHSKLRDKDDSLV